MSVIDPLIAVLPGIPALSSVGPALGRVAQPGSEDNQELSRLA